MTYCMPRPSPVSKTMGSLSPSLWMYSNVKSKKETDIDSQTIIKKQQLYDKKTYINQYGLAETLLFEQHSIKILEHVEQTASLNYLYVALDIFRCSFIEIIFQTFLSVYSMEPLTFTLHVLDQVRIEPDALQLFVKVKSSFPFDFIIWNSIVLVATPCTCTLRTKEGFCKPLCQTWKAWFVKRQEERVGITISKNMGWLHFSSMTKLTYSSLSDRWQCWCQDLYIKRSLHKRGIAYEGQYESSKF